MQNLNVLSNYINLDSMKNIEANSYNESFPFPHAVIDNFVRDDIAESIYNNFPSINDDIWFEYNNPLEKKFLADDIRKFPDILASTIHVLQSQNFLAELEQISGIQNLMSDPYLHGGGLHLITKGDKLGMHLDYSIHPKLKLARRMNLIIYMVDKD